MAKRQRLPTPAEFAPRLALYLDDLDRGATLAAAYKAGAGQRCAGYDFRVTLAVAQAVDPLRERPPYYVYARHTARHTPRRDWQGYAGLACFALSAALMIGLTIWGFRQ